jgi:SAM-dependent methyltransferase
MGINAEFVELLTKLRSRGLMPGGSVVELGAQDLCAAPEVVAALLQKAGIEPGAPVTSAANLYAQLGFARHISIDASGENGALAFDLNRDLSEAYQYVQQFDVVTNLGTAEHCFDQRSVFANIHALCEPGGLMAHAMPAQGNVNHGFYNYQPRFVAELAAANEYEMVELGFTADYTPTYIPYTAEQFRAHDSRDVLLYAVLRRTADAPFRMPFDGMFAAQNQIAGYTEVANPLTGRFAPYLKTGDWSSTRGLSLQESAAIAPHDIGSSRKSWWRRIVPASRARSKA